MRPALLITPAVKRRRRAGNLMGPNVPYEYDVFFSYKRDAESNSWHETLKDKVAFLIKDELGRNELRVFFDKEDINTGEIWKERLTKALGSSKCIVCIWSYTYFQSKYCISEWETFEKRSTELHKVLVAPVRRVKDNTRFPNRAQDRQTLDFSEYFTIFPSFWTSHRAEEFERKLLKRFASDVASIIRDVPEYSDGFPVIDPLTIVTVDEEPTSRPRIDRISDG